MGDLESGDSIGLGSFFWGENRLSGVGFDGPLDAQMVAKQSQDR